MSYGTGAHPLNALRLSLDTAIGNIEAKSPEAIELFCLIGLMPGGVTKDDLKELWGQNWYGDVVVLENA